MNEQLEILKLVALRLDDASIAYMISGSIALSYYAQPRMTRDIDIVIELKSDDAERLVNVFEADFYIDAEMIRDAIARSGMFNVIHYESVMKVDFIIRKDTLYRQKEFMRRRRVEIGSSILWFVTPEDLLLSKLVWAVDSESEMQLNDVRNLVADVVELDWSYIEFWATELQVEAFLREVKE